MGQPNVTMSFAEKRSQQSKQTARQIFEYHCVVGVFRALKLTSVSADWATELGQRLQLEHRLAVHILTQLEGKDFDLLGETVLRAEDNVAPLRILRILAHAELSFKRGELREKGSVPPVDPRETRPSSRESVVAVGPKLSRASSAPLPPASRNVHWLQPAIDHLNGSPDWGTMRAPRLYERNS